MISIFKFFKVSKPIISMVLNVADLGLNTSFPVKASTSPTLSLCFMAL